MSLSAYYLSLMDALHPICPDCLFLIEGTGGGGLAANWGRDICIPGFRVQDSVMRV